MKPNYAHPKVLNMEEVLFRKKTHSFVFKSFSLTLSTYLIMKPRTACTNVEDYIFKCYQLCHMPVFIKHRVESILFISTLLDDPSSNTYCG